MSPVSALEQLYKEVILPRLCAACGACVGNCPYLVKYNGRTVKLDSCSRADGRCYAYCPAVNFDPESISQAIFSQPYDTTGLGVFTEARASRSTSNEILSIAQGGGTVTSLMSMALETGILDAAIVTSAKGPDGFPRGVIATTALAVQESAGSKFVGAHTLDALNLAIERGFTRIGIVGLPCQIRSLRKMQVYDIKDQHLKERVRLVVGLFCNWSFAADEFQSFISRKVGDKKIRNYDVPPPPSNELIVETDDGAESIALEELKPLIQGACRECSDMTSEFADISVGMYEGRPGWNTLMIRSKTGIELIETATHEGVIETGRFPEENLNHLRQASLNKKERVFLTKTETGSSQACHD